LHRIAVMNVDIHVPEYDVADYDEEELMMMMPMQQ
jgi:hypothetical protein